MIDKNIITKFNEEQIRYAVLRINGDIDVSVHKDDWVSIGKIFRDQGYIKGLSNFDKNHIIYVKDVWFDIRHLDDWNGIFYLDEGVYQRRISKEGIFYLSKKDDKIHRTNHYLLTKDRLNFYIIKTILNNPIVFTKTFFSWLIWKIKPFPLIAFIGADGSGKSTAIKNLSRRLKYQTKIFYLGRGKNTIILPKVKIKNPSVLVYWVYSFLSFFDLLIRYYFKILPLRWKKIIITDRSSFDILTMKHIPFYLKKFYLFFFPKPNYTFYLFNDINTLYSRRPNHPVVDLIGQNNIFSGVEAIKIKTNTPKQTVDDICKEIFV